jgi:hypothetical protein
MIWRGLLLLIVALGQVCAQATTSAVATASATGGCTFAAIGYVGLPP